MNEELFNEYGYEISLCVFQAPLNSENGRYIPREMGV
jgi:hypothetical protein